MIFIYIENANILKNDIKTKLIVKLNLNPECFQIPR